MIDLNKLRYFYLVAKYGGYAHTSKKLNMTGPSIIRHIQDLEGALDVKLFERHYRGVALTESGHWLYKRAQKIFIEVDEIEKTIRSSDNEKDQKKTFRISTSSGIASDWLIPFIADFKKQNEDINVIVKSYTHDFKLEDEVSDVAILPRILGQKDITQKFITKLQFRLFASKEYIEKHGLPRNLDDLKQHHIISFSEDKGCLFDGTNFDQSSQLYSDPSIIINSSVGELKLCELGLGIARISTQLNALQKSDLVEVLPDLPPHEIDLFYIYATSTNQKDMIRLFYDHMMGMLPK